MMQKILNYLFSESMSDLNGDTTLTSISIQRIHIAFVALQKIVSIFYNKMV